MCVTAVLAEEATTTPSPPAADDVDAVPAIGPDGAGLSGLVLLFMPPLVAFPPILLVVVVPSTVVAAGRGEATRFGSAPSRRTIHTWHKSTTQRHKNYFAQKTTLKGGGAVDLVASERPNF